MPNLVFLLAGRRAFRRPMLPKYYLHYYNNNKKLAASSSSAAAAAAVSLLAKWQLDNWVTTCWFSLTWQAKHFCQRFANYCHLSPPRIRFVSLHYYAHCCLRYSSVDNLLQMCFFSVAEASPFISPPPATHSTCVLVHRDVVIVRLMFISGIFFVLPCIESYQRVDLRTITLDVPPQEVTDQRLPLWLKTFDWLFKNSQKTQISDIKYYFLSQITGKLIDFKNYYSRYRIADLSSSVLVCMHATKAASLLALIGTD